MLIYAPSSSESVGSIAVSGPTYSLMVMVMVTVKSPFCSTAGFGMNFGG